MNFVENSLSFLGGLTASMLIIQGDTWAGITVYLIIVGFILNNQMPRKK